MKKLLSLLILLLSFACSDDKADTSALMDNGTVARFEVCNRESETLYFALAADYDQPVATIQGWLVINAGDCQPVAKWKPYQVLSQAFYIQSSRGRYIPKSGEFRESKDTMICLPNGTTLGQNFSQSYDALAAYKNDFCPGTMAKKYLTTLGPYESRSPDANTFYYKWTLAGGRYLENERLISVTPPKGPTEDELKSKIATLKRELESLKGKVAECDSRVQSLVMGGKILGTPASRIDDLKDFCNFAVDEHEELKKKAKEAKTLAKETLSSLLMFLNSFYEKLTVVGARVDVLAPYEDDYAGAGVSSLVRPRLDSDANASAQGFFTHIGAKYKETIGGFYGQYTDRFVASTLAFTSTFHSYGSEMLPGEDMDQDRFLDFKDTVDSFEEYFNGLDYEKDKYGYPLGSPVPDDVKLIVMNSIKPNAGAAGVDLENALKRWDGNLTEKQRYILEAVRYLGMAFQQTLLNLPGELASINKRLASITEGAVTAVKDFTVCAAKVGAAGDFGDWYEIVNKKDICTGEEITFAGQVISAAGLVVGSAKFWRVMGEVAGVAVTTKRVFKEAEIIVESAKDIVAHNPINPGVLHTKPIKDLIPVDSRGVPIPNSTVADTFRSGTYLTIKTKEPITLYRAYSDPRKKLGPYWSRVKPTGPKQAVMDSALDPTWGNQATQWVEITVPSGTIIHEGIAAPVSNIPAGIELIGGGSQVYLNDILIPNDWINPLGGGSF